MTVTKIRPDASTVKELLRNDREFLKPLIQATLQEVLEAEMTKRSGPRRESAARRGWAIVRATTHAF